MMLGLIAAACGFACEPPVIPVGADAYSMWDRWPYQRIGARAYLRSTYDRTGGNEWADASHFLYQLADDFNVTLDVAGPGILYFVRFNHWHGSPWHFEVDGQDHRVMESSTADPLHPVADSTFLPAAVFPEPVAVTWSRTRGSDLSWVPIGFRTSFRMAYGRTFYGTGYFVFDQYVDASRLSRPIVAWDGRTPPATGIGELLARAGSDLAPQVGHADTHEAHGSFELAPGAAHPVWDTASGPAMIRALELSAPRSAASALGQARLRITWDGRTSPSVDAPVALFYGAGTLYNRANREFLVKSLPMVVRYESDRVLLDCYFPMPFFRSARIELLGAERSPTPDVKWSVRWVPYRDPPNHVGYFHATYRDHPRPEKGHDLVLLDTRETEGGGVWSGSFVGTTLIFSHDADLGTLEGDPRFFFDDSDTPQGQGTGTEEWAGGGDYWGGETMTLPLAGHPVGAPSPAAALDSEDRIESAYRFLLADLMPFGRRALIRLEHGGIDESTQHYETVTYWYGLPAASLVPTDVLVVGDAESERRHHYSSPQASAPYAITSRYEWGPDMIDGREIYPASSDVGRMTTTQSEFTLHIDPANFGVLLRRKLDYALPNQRAEVYVADPTESAAERATWKLAGIWYTAGSNTTVGSMGLAPPRWRRLLDRVAGRRDDPELRPADHVLETSDRRFRDDEFLIPRELTRARSALRIRVVFKPVAIPVYPGAPPVALAWSELRYTAYSFVMPQFETPGWRRSLRRHARRPASD